MSVGQIKEQKTGIEEKIGTAKIQIILWVVGIGVLLIVADYFLK